MSWSARYPAFNAKAADSGQFAQVARQQSQVERQGVRYDQGVSLVSHRCDEVIQ
jgi:hypothetical protein